MLKFFRTIRKKLIEEDNVRKYLLYAIGEILLVVIGILIALQVNNWNENRLDRQLENKIIERLNSEFTDNLKDLQNVRVRLDSTQIAVEILLDLESRPGKVDWSDEKWNGVILKTLQAPTWNPSSYVLTELKNSGRISTLTNQQMIKDLFSWERFYDNAVENTDNFRRNISSYLDYMVDSGLIRSVNKDFGITHNPLDKEAMNTIMNDARFYNILHEKLLLTTVIIREYDSARDRLVQLIEATN